MSTWHGTERPSRFSLRCGTNFAALSLPIAAVAERVWPLATAAYTPPVVALVSLALRMELWQIVQVSNRRALRVLLPARTAGDGV